ncbi:Crp/Fnr family transcriptional regulator [Mucilaginibacter sp. HMF5004]|uniref:Crp/Fnr family transcriptional regulator n=1 Tax=Mucilaginibacter rivuli TaxID=2857527 RepID=UPI001C5CCE09|nr:Crp/Fnr family transcriptional regulator [Mucilaginibacter rivuli]MBW4889971.1 Crp/Fnr family transcriptional regulator [Mucilaginibacter rivuli]
MKKSKQECDLKSCFLCKLCVKEWLPAVSASRKNFDVKKGEVIVKEGDPVTGVYFVNSGNVKVHKKWGNDKELIVRFASEGAIFGHRGLIAESYPISATALEPTKVCAFDLEFFNTTLKVNHELAYQMIKFLSHDLQESEKRMRNLAHMSVKGRLAQSLLSLKDQFGLAEDGSLKIELSRQDLASFAGATYETVFRVLNDLTSHKLISSNGKSITIVDDKKLLELTKDSSSE